jgi:excisionase family DNA binding protein
MSVEIVPKFGRLLLTLEQAAECLQVSKASLYREVRRGGIPVVKLGSLTRVRADDLERYVGSMTGPPEWEGSNRGR